MTRKYKIYLQEKLLLLEQPVDGHKREADAFISGAADFISFLDQAMAKPGSGDLLLHTREEPGLLLGAACKTITAGGGLVFNAKDELLFILRHNTWDLPKGKLLPNEEATTGALREVSEETGLTRLAIRQEAGISRHIYFHKGKHVLKETHWYDMIFSGDESPVPQTEEDITRVEWIPCRSIPLILKSSYRSIRELATTYLTENPCRGNMSFSP